MAMDATSSSSLRSRRALIAAGLGGIAATAAHALGRPLPARAGHDATNVFHIGESNVAPAGATTSLMTDVSDSGATGFRVDNPNGQAVVGSSASGIGVFGSCDSGQGGQFHSVSGRGVLGGSESGPGVQGTSDTGNGGEFFAGELGDGPGSGVVGRSGSGEAGHFQSTSGSGGVGISDSGAGLHGSSQSGNGVQGFTTSGTAVFGDSGTGPGGSFRSQSDFGVEGRSDTHVGVFGTGTIGMQGFSPSGTGVSGVSETATGVDGRSDSGIGLAGESTSGVGLHGASSTGLALDVLGKARFSTAGSASVAAGQNTAVVANPAATASSHISVTLVGDPGPRQLRWVQRSPGVGFTVHFVGGPPGQRPLVPFTYLIVEPA
jgi:hypothetical protein